MKSVLHKTWICVPNNLLGDLMDDSVYLEVHQGLPLEPDHSIQEIIGDRIYKDMELIYLKLST